MSDELTPYERTYGAPLGATPRPAQPAAPSPAPQSQAQPQPAAATPTPEPGPASAAAPGPSTAPAEPTAPASEPTGSGAAPKPEEAASPSGEPAAPAPAGGATPPAEPPVAPPPSAAPPMDPVPTAPRKAWPWVVLGVAVALLLLVGGCASCALVTTIATLDDHPSLSGSDRIEQDDDAWRDYLYDEDAIEGQLSFEYTLDELEERHGTAEKRGTSGELGEGIYRVGGSGGIAAGTYLLQGSQTEASQVYLYDSVAGKPARDGQRYELHAPLQYLGNYLVELQEGQAVVFLPAGSSMTMAPVPSDPQGVQAPYLSGCYRVGVDIPAGTYVITVEEQSVDAVEDSFAPFGAYMMDDLRYDDDSVTESVEVIPGGKKTVTVKDGQFLELYGTQASPAS